VVGFGVDWSGAYKEGGHEKNMRKNWCAAGLLLCLCLPGCSKQWEEMTAELKNLFPPGQGGEQNGQAERNAEAGAVKYNADTTYHNGFLDFSYTVPRGWWLYKLNEDNFGAMAEETGDLETLDLSYGEDAGMDYSYMGLISFANLQFSTRDNHLGFDISAESLEGIGNLDAYMNYFEGFMLEPDDNTYELLESGTEEINGLAYERRIFEVIREEGNFCFLTFTRPAPAGYYLTIKASYWPENQQPRPEGRGMLFSRGNCTQGFNTF
jgi:hypothetical protein